MSEYNIKRCGTQTNMIAPNTMFTLRVSISDDGALLIDLDAEEEMHPDDVIELLVETIDYLEQS